MAFIPKIVPRDAGSTNRGFASVDPERQRPAPGQPGPLVVRPAARRDTQPLTPRGDNEGGSSRGPLPQHR